MSDDLSKIFGTKKIIVEPTADMREGATQMFQLYQAWIDAGFTPQQALQMLLAVITKG